MKKVISQKGSIHILPLLFFVVAVGLISFLLISSTAPFNSKLFNSLFSKPSSHAASTINSNLGQPTNLTLTSLDSTLRANWTPSTDSATTWQVASVWDGTTLISSKVVSRTQDVADLNGLMPGKTYTVKIQSMDAIGALSNELSATAATDPQQPMKDAAFFESFDEMPPGDLDSNYFDVRSHEDVSEPSSINIDKREAFVSERHFHTQLIGTDGHLGLLVRPRVPFDISGGRVGTFQTEVDMSPAQQRGGKWFEITLSKDIISNTENMGDGDDGDLPNAVSFTIFDTVDAQLVNGHNLPKIAVNVNGVRKEFDGTVAQYSPTNVRVPVVLKVSQTSAEMFINGVSVLKASGFTLPFDQGYWSIAHRNYFQSNTASESGYAQPFLPIVQLIHWDTIQFDGPPGSYNPVVKTYLEPGCTGVVNIFVPKPPYGTAGSPFNPASNQNRCKPFIGWDVTTPGGNTQTVTLQIPDDVSKARSAQFLFNNKVTNARISINGSSLIPVPLPSYDNPYEDSLNVLQLTPEQTKLLKTGSNQITVSVDDWGYPGPTNLELEVVYNIPRTITPFPDMPMAMLAVTSPSFRVQRVASGPMTQTVTTNLYNQGGVDPVNWNAQIITTDTPWFTLSTSSGTISPIPNGGSLQPITFMVDFNQIGTTDKMGKTAVVKINGGSMPVYVAVQAVNDGVAQAPKYITTGFTYMNTFNKAAIPDYSGISTSSTPTPTPSSCVKASLGDINCDGKIDIFDYNILVTNFNKTGIGVEGDLNNDGIINIFDYNILIGNFGK